MSAKLSAESEYLIGEIHHLLLLRVHPLVIAEQLHRKPVSLYKLLLTHGDEVAEQFASYRSEPTQTYTREQVERRNRLSRERRAKRQHA